MILVRRRATPGVSSMAGSDPPPPIVSQLRDAIRTSGLSLGQLSAASGVNAGQLSRFMRGERGLTLDSAGAVCKALGIDLNVPETPSGDVEQPPPEPAPKSPRRGKK